MPRWKTKFSEQWLAMPEYRDWLEPGIDKYSAKCRLCKKEFGISSMGESALWSHSRGTKHLDLLQKWKKNSTSTIQHFFTEKVPSKTNKVESAPSSAKATLPAGSVSSFLSRNECLKSEVLWALKSTKSHYSFSSCADIQSLFELHMFIHGIYMQGNTVIINHSVLETNPEKSYV